MTVAVSSKGKWKTVWQGARNAETDCGAGDGSETDLPSSTVRVWPSPNGNHALVTYWELQGFNYYAVHQWVSLAPGTNQGKKVAPKAAKDGTANPMASATHAVFRTAGAKEPWLNLRSKPSGKAAIKAKMVDGTQVRRLDDKTYGRKGWAYKVQILSGPHAGTTGFAGKSYLKSLGTD